VAIETPRGLLVAVPRTTGRPVYAINPLAVARYRERHVQSGRKSDHADAMVLAAFAGKTTNLVSAEARAVLAIAPTPAVADTLSKARIAAALRRAGRSGRGSIPFVRTYW
jgi:Transposase